MIKSALKYLMDTFERKAVNSAKRMSAFVFMLLIVMLHVYFIIYAHRSGNWTDLEIILSIDSANLLSLLGIEAWAKKNESKQDSDT